MNKRLTKIGLGVFALAAVAGNATAQVKPSGAERGLVGVNLYDSGVKVVSLYGSPDEIQAVNIGGGTTVGGGGNPGFGGPGFGGPAGGPGMSRPGGSPGPAGAPSADSANPFAFGDDFFRQAAPAPPRKPGMGGPGAMPPSGAGSPYGPGGAPGRGGAPFGPGAPGGSPGSNLGGGQAESTQYTRWIYNRGGSKYGFIVDKMGRVVQIEAIGLQNNRVKTRRGIGFGATFAQLVKTYGNPDGYEVGGDTILVKYLVNKKVAFRLTRLGAKKPHVVTGVVVAAGKV